MKRLLCLILVFLILFLSACGSIKPYNENNNQSKITVSEPQEDSLDDYVEVPQENKAASEIQTYSSTGSAETKADSFDGTYYANTNTHKFHKSTCASAKIIKEKNLYITNSRDELINAGYEPCLRCNP